MSKKNKIANLITFANAEGDMFSTFKNDRERIKYMSRAYKNMSIAKAFAVYYGLSIDNSIKTAEDVNNITNIVIGNVYLGSVKDFDKNILTFTIPGVKEELISQDNFNNCMDEVRNYLMNHDNKLLFEVREKRNGKYIVSVVQGYYRYWLKTVEQMIEREESLTVHIDSLVNGGYICHTDIWPINQLTGKNYTSSVFIPGSHIVLNIEHDFNKWLDQDVQIIPQKFVDFRTNRFTGEVEKSLVCSRKRVLQIEGNQNLNAIYARYLLGQKDDVKYTPEIFNGVVTGIINSAKKTGVFIEIPNQSITGLMPIDASKLCDYRVGNAVDVRIKEFEVQEGKEPFVLNKKGKVIKCNTRPVFELA